MTNSRSKYRAIRTEVKESDIQKACTDLLDAYRIPWLRMNTGAMKGSHKGKRWYVRFGRKGQADLLAWPEVIDSLGERIVRGTIWLEIKRPDGKQSDDQKEFQQWAESIGHSYLLVRDVSELEAWLKR